MNKKVLLLLLLICIGCIILFSYYSDNSEGFNESNKKTLNISGGGYDVDAFVGNLNTMKYYKGHDEKTKLWLMTLSGNVVFSSNGYYVVMSRTDAAKLPFEDATDVMITDTFSCEVLENRSLGDKFGDVLYVRDVEFIKQDIKSYEV